MTVTLYPGRVFFTTIGGGSISGTDETLWTDNDDITYTLIGWGAAGWDVVRAPLDLLVAPGVPTWARLNIRAKVWPGSTSGDPTFLYANLLSSPTSGDLLGAFSNGDPTYNAIAIPNDGAIHDLSFPLTHITTNMANVGAALRASGYVQIDCHEPDNGGDFYVYIYELNVTLDLALVGAPPQRLYPRNDGLGLSSGQRIYPPPRSRQRSGRLGPAGYL